MRSTFLDSCNDLACLKECKKKDVSYKMVKIMKCMSAHTDFVKSESQKKKSKRERSTWWERKGVESKNFLDRISLTNSFLSRFSPHCGLLLWEQLKIQ